MTKDIIENMEGTHGTCISTWNASSMNENYPSIVIGNIEDGNVCPPVHPSIATE